MYLLDSNILIYSAQPSFLHLRKYLSQKGNAVSAISLIEVLGYWKLIEKDRIYFKACFELLNVYPVNDDVISESIHLRSDYKMSTADSIIAATCKIFNKTLLTRNTEDFTKIKGLKMTDPIENH